MEGGSVYSDSVSQWMRDILFGEGASRRYILDVPLGEAVWLAYATHDRQSLPEERLSPYRCSLLLGSVDPVSADALYAHLLARIAAARRCHLFPGEPSVDIAAYLRRFEIRRNANRIALRMSFREMVVLLLPMTEWWQTTVWGHSSPQAAGVRGHDYVKDMTGKIEHDETAIRRFPVRSGGGTSSVVRHGRTILPPSFLWSVRALGYTDLLDRATQGSLQSEREPNGVSWGMVASCLQELSRESAQLDTELRSMARLSAVQGLSYSADQRMAQPLLRSIEINRTVTHAASRSSLTVKADAARLLFDISCADLTWAVVDTGIDARHPAFRYRAQVDSSDSDQYSRLDAGVGASYATRVIRTYDFTNPEFCDHSAGERYFENLVLGQVTGPATPPSFSWSQWEERLRIPYRRSVVQSDDGDAAKEYVPPSHDHGTVVAGILGGCWPEAPPEAVGYDPNRSDGYQGICPDLCLYDLRVFSASDSPGIEPRSDEFTLCSALQFIRYLNAKGPKRTIHGANLSLSVAYDVTSAACGRTPLCLECEELVEHGVVVVAAAGNGGFSFEGSWYDGSGHRRGGHYRVRCISDPGSAEAVITVGATHRSEPHTYGVSYFSGVGPTGDGRFKPDLVAPGEGITGPAIGNSYACMDGTSMAAAHVSGAAALLIARHTELLGDPERIKEILCSTTTDLKRDRYAQGAGLVDILRALQSV